MVNPLGGMMADAYPLAGVLLLITASLLALLYMASVILNHRKLRSWIYNEAFQAFATALFLFLATGLLSAAADLTGVFYAKLAEQNNLGEVSDLVTANAQVENSAEEHILFARAYLLTRLDKLNSYYNTFFYLYTITAASGSQSVNFPEYPGVKFSLGLFDWIAKFVQPFVEYSYYGFLFIYFQLGLLELIKSYFFYAFPAGLVMRSFPFTRSLGSFLISSAIALYFVYPFFLSLLLLTNYDSTLQIAESDIMNAAKSEYPGQYLVYWVQQKLRHEQIAGDAGMSQSIQNTVFSAFSFIQFILLTMILYPLISFVAAYTFLHQFSALMQANVADLGRGLLKLI